MDKIQIALAITLELIRTDLCSLKGNTTKEIGTEFAELYNAIYESLSL